MSDTKTTGMATVNLPFLRTRLVVYDRKKTVSTGPNGTQIVTETGTCKYRGKEYSVRRFSSTGIWHYGMH